MSEIKVSEYKAFFNNVIWKEIEEAVKEGYTEDLHKLTSADNIKEVKFLQGRIAAGLFILNLSETTIATAEAEEKAKAREGDSNGN